MRVLLVIMISLLFAALISILLVNVYFYYRKKKFATDMSERLYENQVTEYEHFTEDLDFYSN